MDAISSNEQDNQLQEEEEGEQQQQQQQQNKSKTKKKDDDDDDAYTPYQGEQPKEALSEIFVPQVFSHSLNKGVDDNIDEEKLWVPQTDSVSFRPLMACCVLHGF